MCQVHRNDPETRRSASVPREETVSRLRRSVPFLFRDPVAESVSNPDRDPIMLNVPGANRDPTISSVPPTKSDPYFASVPDGQ